MASPQDLLLSTSANCAGVRRTHGHVRAGQLPARRCGRAAQRARPTNPGKSSVFCAGCIFSRQGHLRQGVRSAAGSRVADLRSRECSSLTLNGRPPLGRHPASRSTRSGRLRRSMSSPAIRGPPPTGYAAPAPICGRRRRSVASRCSEVSRSSVEVRARSCKLKIFAERLLPRGLRGPRRHEPGRRLRCHRCPRTPAQFRRGRPFATARGRQSSIRPRGHSGAER